MDAWGIANELFNMHVTNLHARHTATKKIYLMNVVWSPLCGAFDGSEYQETMQRVGGPFAPNPGS